MGLILIRLFNCSTILRRITLYLYILNDKDIMQLKLEQKMTDSE